MGLVERSTLALRVLSNVVWKEQKSTKKAPIFEWEIKQRLKWPLARRYSYQIFLKFCSSCQEEFFLLPRAQSQRPRLRSKNFGISGRKEKSIIDILSLATKCPFVRYGGMRGRRGRTESEVELGRDSNMYSVALILYRSKFVLFWWSR